jgi:hypothetical protein
VYLPVRLTAGEYELSCRVRGRTVVHTPTMGKYDASG